MRMSKGCVATTSRHRWRNPKGSTRARRGFWASNMVQAGINTLNKMVADRLHPSPLALALAHPLVRGFWWQSEASE